MGLGLFQLAVAAAVKNQGQFFLAVEGFDQADKDQMVAAGVAHLVAAFEPGAAARQYRCAAGADAQFDVGKVIASRCRIGIDSKLRLHAREIANISVGAAMDVFCFGNESNLLVRIDVVLDENSFKRFQG